MTYPTEPQSAIGQTLRDRCDREAVKIALIGKPAGVDQCVIELERRGFCDSYAWSPPIPVPENASMPNSASLGAIVQVRSGEVIRLYKRWYLPTAQRIFL
ncbi:hypothetical protein [Leptolyngbya sp. FACHB-711]|uniref:hypothetical protein n=1 Tax=unclassified Leptolyngbya TaxID=2650499 RepID=UPI0016871B61|nr:hypothetical protein [Leptolyngbya sp. FACHB-711]MBD1853777.1 hypothetical protein [Cyanobacteria bacterium FACHB-502]MBD2027297.1 hypothetical protein [Leptolyngbya sp. FACHB-711]